MSGQEIGAASARIAVERGDWAALAAAAMPIRYEVFVGEQGVPEELEHDEFDAVSLHAVARETGRAVGTGRLLPDGHIGRLAVLGPWRRGGVGRALMRCLLEAAEARGDARVILHAQVNAVPFYASLGFVEDGSVFMEAGIAHITMTKALTPVA